jgi:serine/threonine protein kinase
LLVLHERIRNDPEMLQGFRRGVSSMRILGKASVRGIVPYCRASEIPAFVVMEFIEGPTLQQAVEQRIIRGWDALLRVAVDLADILRRSHQLPERVLHRDIRPSNIMLRNGWDRGDDWELLVLDFDLSWHRGAPELSITKGTTSNSRRAGVI